MAAPSRRTSSALEAESVWRSLFERGFCFDFFQAVRLLHRIAPERGQVGTTARVQDEACRFQSHASLAFPASAIHSIVQSPEDLLPVKVTVAFMGLFGEEGVLPAWYTERIIARKLSRDGALEAFLNVFNHRVISLFYRAWQKHRPAVQYELAAARGEGLDPFTTALYDLIGLGTPGLRGRVGVPDVALLRYAGLIRQRPRSAVALRGIVRDYFGASVAVDQFIGAWYSVPTEDRAWLHTASESSQLGTGAFLGARVWDQQSRIRLRLGPLSLRRFQELLPGGRSHEALASLTRYLVGHSLAFDIQLVLLSADVPYCRLTDRASNAPRLGRMAWLKTREFRSDADDALFKDVRSAA